VTPGAVTVRDAGLALISRINRWMIAGAVALAGLISIAAANAFHGHTVKTPSAPAATGAATTTTTQSQSSATDGGSTLQQPAQAPAPAPAAPSPPVVSGGS
jgi:hypothetical protein